MYGHFMQESAMAQTANKSMNVLGEAFGKQVMRQGLLPAHSSDLNSCDFHLWGTLKDKAYMNNPHSLQ
jgi:hypothetical protein